MKANNRRRNVFLIKMSLAVVLLGSLSFLEASAETATSQIPGLVAAPVENSGVQGPASSTPGPIYTPPAEYGPQNAPQTGNGGSNPFVPGAKQAPSTSTSSNPFVPGAKQVQNGAGVYIPTSGEIGLSDRSIKDILVNLLRWLLSVVGVIALIGFVISGTQYILAAGDEKLMETGKKNMLYSIMGITVVLASLVIVQAIDYALRGYSAF